MPKRLRTDLSTLPKRRDPRPSASRTYGRKWQRARRAFLAANPLCVSCMAQGRVVAASVVDHIRPHRGNDELFWNPVNWQPLCKRCHDRKTGHEQGGVFQISENSLPVERGPGTFFHERVEL